MDIFKKHKKKILIFGITVIIICLWCVSCSVNDYYEPEWAKEDISAVIKKKKLTEEDYNFLFRQTGLSKSAVNDLIEDGKKDDIFEFAEQYFKKPKHEREYLFFPIVAYDEKVDDRIKIAPLRRGDVVVSLSTYTLGYRHGHAAIVIDEDTGRIIEHMVLGETSDYSYISGWENYSNMVVLRHKNSKIAEKAADYAEEKLVGVPYNPMAGIFKKDKSDEEKISSSQCSHLVWQAF